MSIVEKLFSNIRESRQKALKGEVNCIPSPFSRFKIDFPGIERQCYYLLTSQTKGSKSQFTMFFFVYNTIEYALRHPENMQLHIIIFPLEETPERIMLRYLSFLISERSNGTVRISPKELRSVGSVLDESILVYLNDEWILQRLKYFEEHVQFSLEVNPTGIMKVCREYAEQHGTTKYETVTSKDELGMETTKRIPVSYESSNPNEYRIVIVDTVNLVMPEAKLSLKQSIDTLSTYFIRDIRNRYGFTIVAIQQQSSESENNMARKDGMTKPSIANLGDSKYTSHDADITFGLYAPARYGVQRWLGYNIERFGDNIRFLEVLTNRDGPTGGTCPLLFDGATCSFWELPLPDEKQRIEELLRIVYHWRGEEYDDSPSLFDDDDENLID